MKITLFILCFNLVTLLTTQANNWGINLGNGVGFYWGNQNNNCNTGYSTTYYYPQQQIYIQPQTTYMQPYWQQRPQTYYYYPQPQIIYRQQYYRCR